MESLMLANKNFKDIKFVPQTRKYDELKEPDYNVRPLTMTKKKNRINNYERKF